MAPNNTIEHKGIVIEADNSRVLVQVRVEEACGACNSKGSCQVAGSPNKTYEFKNPVGQYKIGETVNLVLKKSLGYRAVFLAYVLPLILVLSSLFILSNFVKNEGILIGVIFGTLIIYFFILYLLRDLISKKFTIDIIKQNS